jgi:hypothetical protein
MDPRVGAKGGTRTRREAAVCGCSRGGRREGEARPEREGSGVQPPAESAGSLRAQRASHPHAGVDGSRLTRELVRKGGLALVEGQRLVAVVEGVAGLAKARPERVVDGLRPPADSDEPPRAKRASNPHMDLHSLRSIRELVRKGGLAHGERLRYAVVAGGVAGRATPDRRGRGAAYNRPQSPPGRRARSARATPTLASTDHG